MQGLEMDPALRGTSPPRVKPEPVRSKLRFPPVRTVIRSSGASGSATLSPLIFPGRASHPVIALFYHLGGRGEKDPNHHKKVRAVGDVGSLLEKSSAGFMHTRKDCCGVVEGG